jgi:tellurite resistance-related uncharacterized protein
LFDEANLPEALRRDHATKAGTWGVIRVLGGEALLHFGARQVLLTAERPGLIEPEERHRVEPLSGMRMQVEFYDVPPALPEPG